MKGSFAEEGEQLWNNKHGFFSCWGRLNPASAWRKLRQWTERRRGRRVRLHLKKRKSFKYDPLSYAQNFDEGDWDEEESPGRGFSSRFTARMPLAGPSLPTESQSWQVKRSSACASAASFSSMDFDHSCVSKSMYSKHGKCTSSRFHLSFIHDDDRCSSLVSIFDLSCHQG